MIVCADTSAVIKLLVEEWESPSIGAWFRSTGHDLVGSQLLRTELRCGVRRRAGDRYEAAEVEAVVELVEAAAAAGLEVVAPR